MTDKQLIFVHIPRTAGTSFGTAVADWFRATDRLVCPYSNWPHFVENKDKLIEFDLIGGHNYKPLEKLLVREHEFFTLLGEPINRTISHRNLREKSNHPYMSGKTLEESVDDPTWALIANNFQTRMLGCDFGDEVQNDFDFDMKVQPTRDSLKIAKERLESFAFVGIKESYTASVELFNRTFNATCRAYSEGNTGYRSCMNLRTMKKLVEINEYDIELYRFGLDLYRSRL